MNGSRSISLAVLLSLLLHAMLLAIGAGGSTERSLFMTLNDDKGVANRLNGGEPGTLSVLLVTQDGQSSTTSPDTSFDFQKNDGRLVSADITGVSKPFPEAKSPNDPSDQLDPADLADSTPVSPTGASKPEHHSIPLDDYSAQIVGRIERTWVRPLAHLEGAFRCEVRISQTPQGEVRDITLMNCDGDPDWRQSITRAIRYASPLPAPPSEKAFRPVITLNFETEPLSGAMLARLLSVSEGVGPVEHRDNTIKPKRDSAPIGDPRAADHHAQ